jgi:hypothetical protein
VQNFISFIEHEHVFGFASPNGPGIPIHSASGSVRCSHHEHYPPPYRFVFDPLISIPKIDVISDDCSLGIYLCAPMSSSGHKMPMIPCSITVNPPLLRLDISVFQGAQSSIYDLYMILTPPSNYRHNSTMPQNTAKLGGPASDVVVAKVGVSYNILSASTFNIRLRPSLIHSMDL